jgi:hypothetical protein
MKISKTALWLSAIDALLVLTTSAPVYSTGRTTWFHTATSPVLSLPVSDGRELLVPR